MTPTEMLPPQTPRCAPEEEAACQSGDASLEWLGGQPASFFRPYAGKWIAVQDCQVLASADNHRDLMGQLQGLDPRRILIHRVERFGKVIYR
jgi:hypothetical protein